MSNSLTTHGLQHTRLPCHSPSPRACSNSCPLSQWCHLTFSSTAVHFSSCFQSSPASGGQIIASASDLQDWFPFKWTGLISLQSKGLSRVQLSSLLQHHSSKASILQHSAFFMVQFSHPFLTTGKTIALTMWTLAGKVISLLFNMLPSFVITFHPRSKHLLISWLQSPYAAILESKKIKSVTVSIVYPSICHEIMRLDVIILVFWMLSFKPAF